MSKTPSNVSLMVNHTDMKLIVRDGIGCFVDYSAKNSMEVTSIKQLASGAFEIVLAKLPEVEAQGG
jgi:hypothetical protein